MTIFKPENIPAVLKRYDQWVLWRYEQLQENKLSKIPYQSSGRRASSASPATWSPFNTALEVYRRHLDAGGFTKRYDGLGFVLSAADPFVAIDMDKSRNHGRIAAWAKEAAAVLDTYTEISPSGNGLRLFLIGNLPPFGRKYGPMEMYDALRFVTITGNVLANHSVIRMRQKALLKVHREYFGEADPNGLINARGLDFEAGPRNYDLEERLDNIRQSASKEAFELLYDTGDLTAYGDDHSVADLALCGYLAFWLRFPKIIDDAFRKSALMRDKWDAKRGAFTYGERTIMTALAGRTKFYDRTSDEQHALLKDSVPAGFWQDA